MKLNELRDKVHENAKAKGFYKPEESTAVLLRGIEPACSGAKHAFFAQKIALIHSELSEALDADRMNNTTKSKIKNAGYTTSDAGLICSEYFVNNFNNLVKNTVEDELADVIIRVLDLCGYLEIDIEKHVEMKMRYNKTREYKHGKNY